MDDKSYFHISKKWVRTGLVVGVTALIVAPLAAVASHNFNDVPDTNTFHDDIDWLAEAGVTRGCNPPDNTEFCPDDEVTREQMAAFMRRFAQYLDAEDGTPAQADHATTADDAMTLNGRNASFYTNVAAADVLEDPAGSGVPLANTGVVVSEVTLDAPQSGFAFVNGTSTLGDSNATGRLMTWIEVDDGSCAIAEMSVVPNNHVVGSLSYEDPADFGDEVALASSALAPVSSGDHTLTLCAASSDDTGAALVGSLTAIWMEEATVSATRHGSGT